MTRSMTRFPDGQMTRRARLDHNSWVVGDDVSRILYFDCFSGIAGDMALGAMLDAGLPREGLKAALGSLAMSGYDIRTERVLRAGVSATRFVVHEHQAADAGSPGHSHHPHRHLTAIFKLIDQS